MADFLGEVFGVIRKRYKDMGDGTHAEVVAVGGSGSPLPVGGEGDVFTAVPTITAGAYAAGDAVGELIELANAVREAGGGGFVVGIVAIDDAGQDAELEFWLFDDEITDVDDNDAWAPAEADLEHLVAIVSSNDGSWCAAGTPSALDVDAVRRFNVVDTSLYLKIVTRGTPTFAATDDLTVRVKIAQD